MLFKVLRNNYIFQGYYCSAVALLSVWHGSSYVCSIKVTVVAMVICGMWRMESGRFTPIKKRTMYSFVMELHPPITLLLLCHGAPLTLLLLCHGAPLTLLLLCHGAPPYTVTPLPWPPLQCYSCHGAPLSLLLLCHGAPLALLLLCHGAPLTLLLLCHGAPTYTVTPLSWSLLTPYSSVMEPPLHPTPLSWSPPLYL